MDAERKPQTPEWAALRNIQQDQETQALARAASLRDARKAQLLAKQNKKAAKEPDGGDDKKQEDQETWSNNGNTTNIDDIHHIGNTNNDNSHHIHNIALMLSLLNMILIFNRA